MIQATVNGTHTHTIDQQLFICGEKQSTTQAQPVRILGGGGRDYLTLSTHPAPTLRLLMTNRQGALHVRASGLTSA